MWSKRKFQRLQREALQWEKLKDLKTVRVVHDPENPKGEELHVTHRTHLNPVLKICPLGKIQAEGWAHLPKRYLEALAELKEARHRIEELEAGRWEGNKPLITAEASERAAEVFYEKLRHINGDPAIPAWDKNWNNRSKYMAAMYETLMDLAGDEEDDARPEEPHPIETIQKENDDE